MPIVGDVADRYYMSYGNFITDLDVVEDSFIGCQDSPALVTIATAKSRMSHGMLPNLFSAPRGVTTIFAVQSHGTTKRTPNDQNHQDSIRNE